MFGRPPRDTGLESERNNRPTAAQRLHLLNSSHIQRKIEQSRMIQNLTQAKQAIRARSPADCTWRSSRVPDRGGIEDRRSAISQSGTASRREAAVDLVWALINSAEFLYRH